MADILNSKMIILFYSILFMIRIKSSKQIQEYTISIPLGESELGLYNISYYEDKDFKCEKLIPSLFTPIFLILKSQIDGTELEKIKIFSPVLSFEKNATIFFFNFKYLNKYDIFLGELRFIPYENLYCYFGLTNRTGEYGDIKEDYIFINKLKERGEISKKIFSFKKWTIDNNNNEISTSLYLGDEHEPFLSKNNKDGVIGQCKVNEDYKYWGCFFTEMSINENLVDLKKANSNDYYKIYFSSESHDIIFPDQFIDKFKILTGDNCTYNEEKGTTNNYAICRNFFNNDDYASLNLISNKMVITIEIDNQKRFCKDDKEKKELSRIKFEDIDYFILPLIMFKQFDIQFDAEKDRIQFFTTNQSLLQIKEEKGKKSSNGLKVFLIIFIIIILILTLGFIIYWLLKKRRGSVEKNINKYNKFDEDENFQNMNEQRVF